MFISLLDQLRAVIEYREARDSFMLKLDNKELDFLSNSDIHYTDNEHLTVLELGYSLDKLKYSGFEYIELQQMIKELIHD